MESDRDLEQRFAAERAADERAVPAFGRVIAARPSAARASWIRVAIAAVVIVSAVVGTWRGLTPKQPIIAFTPGDMRVPTDYLLETLSYPRAGEIPRISTSGLLLPLTSDGSDTRRLP